MNDKDKMTIDDDTIKKVGLRLSEKPVNADTATSSRVFEYPNLDNVFIMESDLYGNAMPLHSCFLAFAGNHGLMGQHLKIETLRNASVADIKKLVQSNNEG